MAVPDETRGPGEASAPQVTPGAAENSGSIEFVLGVMEHGPITMPSGGPPPPTAPAAPSTPEERLAERIAHSDGMPTYEADPGNPTLDRVVGEMVATGLPTDEAMGDLARENASALDTGPASSSPPATRRMRRWLRARALVALLVAIVFVITIGAFELLPRQGGDPSLPAGVTVGGGGQGIGGPAAGGGAAGQADRPAAQGQAVEPRQPAGGAAQQPADQPDAGRVAAPPGVGISPGTLSGTFDVASVMKASHALIEEIDAFITYVKENRVSLVVEMPKAPSGPAKVTGDFVLTVPNIDKKDPRCVLTILFVGTMTGTYAIEDSVHVASGSAKGTGTPSMSGCEAAGSLNDVPQPMPKITWKLTGDGQTMKGDFVIIAPSDGSSMDWKFEVGVQ